MKKLILALFILASFGLSSQNLIRQFSFNRNAIDLDSVGNNAVLAGAVIADSRTGVGNTQDDGSLYFAFGNNDVIDVNPINNQNWTGAAYSVWVRGCTDGVIVQFPFGGYSISATPSGRINGSMDGSSANPAQSTFSLNDGLWHHVVVQNSGTQTNLYIDKVLNASIVENLFTPNTFNSNAELHFGRDRFRNNRLTGEIDEFRMFDDTLSQLQIDSLYDLAKPESTRYLEVDYKFNNNFADSSLNANNLTYRTGNRHTFVSGRSGIGADSSVNMSNAHMRTVREIHNNLWQEMSVSFWANNPGQGTVVQGYNMGYGLGFGQLGDAQFYANGSSAGSLTATPANYLNDGLWHHVVAVNTGDTSYLYIDGVLDNKQAETYFSQSNINTNQHIYFGTRMFFNNGSETFNTVMSNGKVDDLKLYSKALNQTEITNLFLRNIATQSKEVKVQVDEFKVFPNPTTNQLTLPREYQSSELIQIFNASGQLVLNTYNQTNLNVQSLDSGVYFIVVLNEGNYSRSKFLKQ